MPGMPALNQLKQRNLDLLARAGIAYRLVEHEPVFDYPTAHAVRQRFNLRGTESKSLFLDLRDGRHALLLTLEGQRADWSQLKYLLGRRPRIASDAELTQLTACLPGCACPFGHAAEIPLLLDERVLTVEHLLYSPGPPELTLEIAGCDLPQLLAVLPNPLLRLVRSDGAGTRDPLE